MKKTIAEVKAELSGCTVEMLRNIVRKDSTVKGVSRMRKAELVEAAALVVSKLNPEVVEAVEAEVESEYLTDEELANAVKEGDLQKSLDELGKVYHKIYRAFLKDEELKFSRMASGEEKAKAEHEIASEYGAGIAEVLSYFASYESYHMMKKSKTDLARMASAILRADAIPSTKDALVTMLQLVKGELERIDDDLTVREHRVPEVVEQPVEAKAVPAVEIDDHEHRVAKVRAASTVEELEAVISEFTKAEMIYVFEDITCGTKTAKVSTPKDELVSQIARWIVEYREEEKFRALSLDEKYEYLTSRKDKHEVHQVFWWMTNGEFTEIARRVGVAPTDAYVVSKTIQALSGIADANKAADAVPEAAAAPSRRKAADEERAVDAIVSLYFPNSSSTPATEIKEEKTMNATKLTVNEAVAALQTAETESEMHEILMQCKREDMVSALSVLTDGAKYVRAAQSSNETARRVIAELQDWREEEAYRALPYEEKYAALIDADNVKVHMYVRLMSDGELTETASRLEVQIPVNVGEYLPYSMNLETKVEYMMQALREAEAIKSVGNPEKADDLWYRLNRASDLSLAIMVRKVGLEVEVRCSCYNTEARDAIFKHYATDEHKGVYEPESSEEGYSDYAGDNASLDADIEVDGAPLCEDLPEESGSAEVDDAVANAIRIIGSDAGYVEKHEALTKCSDPEMFAVMRACTGRPN